MNNSYFLKLFAQANRDKGYWHYAESLENLAAVKEAEEVLKGEEDEDDI